MILSLCVDSDKDSGSCDAVKVQPGSVEYYRRWLMMFNFQSLLAVCCFFLLLFRQQPVEGGAKMSAAVVQGRCYHTHSFSHSFPFIGQVDMCNVIYMNRET